MTEGHDGRREVGVESSEARDRLSRGSAERILAVVRPQRRVVSSGFEDFKARVAVGAEGLRRECQHATCRREGRTNGSEEAGLDAENLHESRFDLQIIQWRRLGREREGRRTLVISSLSSASVRSAMSLPEQ